MFKSGKWLLVRVTDLKTGDKKADVKIPVGLANFGLKMAAKYAPESIEGLNMDEIIAFVKDGGEGKIVDVEDPEKGEHVEVYVD
jgi:hypothetical protein